MAHNFPYNLFFHIPSDGHDSFFHDNHFQGDPSFHGGPLPFFDHPFSRENSLFLCHGPPPPPAPHHHHDPVFIIPITGASCVPPPLHDDNGLNRFCHVLRVFYWFYALSVWSLLYCFPRPCFSCVVVALIGAQGWEELPFSNFNAKCFQRVFFGPGTYCHRRCFSGMTNNNRCGSGGGSGGGRRNPWCRRGMNNNNHQQQQQLPTTTMMLPSKSSSRLLHYHHELLKPQPRKTLQMVVSHSLATSVLRSITMKLRNVWLSPWMLLDLLLTTLILARKVMICVSSLREAVQIGSEILYTFRSALNPPTL
jgi:hypothetical protein